MGPFERSAAYLFVGFHGEHVALGSCVNFEYYLKVVDEDMGVPVPFGVLAVDGFNE